MRQANPPAPNSASSKLPGSGATSAISPAFSAVIVPEATMEIAPGEACPGPGWAGAWLVWKVEPVRSPKVNFVGSTLRVRKTELEPAEVRKMLRPSPPPVSLLNSRKLPGCSVASTAELEYVWPPTVIDRLPNTSPNVTPVEGMLL